MSEGKDRPEIKREKMRQEELKKPSSSIKGNSLANLVGDLGWKGTGILILVLILIFIIYHAFFRYSDILNGAKLFRILNCRSETMNEDKNSHDDSFKQLNKKEKVATIIGILLLLILVVGFVLGVFFLGFAGMFRVLGVQYDSIWALLLFVVLFFVIGFFFDFIFGVLANLTKRYIIDQRISFSITFLF